MLSFRQSQNFGRGTSDEKRKFSGAKSYYIEIPLRTSFGMTG